MLDIGYFCPAGRFDTKISVVGSLVAEIFVLVTDAAGQTTDRQLEL